MQVHDIASVREMSKKLWHWIYDNAIGHLPVIFFVSINYIYEKLKCTVSCVIFVYKYKMR